MNKRTFVHLVCSPRTRVGKTLVARVLIDYFLAKGEPVAGYDTNVNEPVLAEQFPHTVTAADVRNVQGQVALFDGLLVDDDRPKVVDVWHRVFDKIFDLIEQIDFIGEAEKRNVVPVIYYIDDPDTLTETTHARLRDRFPETRFVSVYNQAASGVGAVTGPRSGVPTTFHLEPRLQIPPLDPVLRRAIDMPGFSLSDFMRGQDKSGASIVVRAAVRAWTSKVFIQLQDFELRQSLSDAEFLK